MAMLLCMAAAGVLWLGLAEFKKFLKMALLLGMTAAAEVLWLGLEELKHFSTRWQCFCAWQQQEFCGLVWQQLLRGWFDPQWPRWFDISSFHPDYYFNLSV
ncbi:uncharacterized protein [Procambarus clarkii]|uniref:uncharacterized protein isoform X1 n=2 Tax=Procambarus clarkii TaxID=6728 RepID=UPI003743EAEB